MTEGVVARVSLTGERGFEISVPAAQQRSLYRTLRDAGAPYGLKPIGLRALDSLRLEKAYGVWSAEFTQGETPGTSGLDRFIAFEKPDFIGRDAALRERDRGADRRLVLLEILVNDADAHGFEPVWCEGRKVGHVTSGTYGHHVGRSLALASLNAAVATDMPPLSVHVLGEQHAARVLREPPYDPQGRRLRH